MDASMEGRVERLHEAVYGNGRLGLIREQDKIKTDVTQLGRETAQLSADVKALVKKIDDGMKWVMITLLAVCGKIAWEVAAKAIVPGLAASLQRLWPS